MPAKTLAIEAKSLADKAGASEAVRLAAAEAAGHLESLEHAFEEIGAAMAEAEITELRRIALDRCNGDKERAGRCLEAYLAGRAHFQQGSRPQPMLRMAR